MLNTRLGENVSHRSYFGADPSSSRIGSKSRELGLLKKYQSATRVDDAESRGTIRLNDYRTIQLTGRNAQLGNEHSQLHIW